MADIAVNFAVKLLGLALDEIKHQRGVRDDVEWLHRELQRMRCFLLDAQRRSSSGDETVKNWVKEITNAAYEAEDIAAKFARRQQRRGVKATLQRYGFPSKELHDIGNDIKRLKEKIVDIGQSSERYGIGSSSSNAGCSNNNTVHELRRRPLYQSEEHVFGLENDKNRVMELLYAKESRCYVIGIVGMGGMGKTTLARQVFKGIDWREFPKTAWVVLSQNYIQNHSIHKLLIEIAKHVMPDSPDLAIKRTDELSDLVKTVLRDGRYLIVMDDMWEEEVWDLVKEHLPDRKNGSRIIITTRNEKVAEHPALHFPPHRMEGLDALRSWDLFTHLVFEDGEHLRRECTGRLKELAKELVCGCGGSPLALTILGGLLAGKEKTHSAWREVVGNKKWMQGEAGKNCLEILKLSYMDLPHHLKLCFLYLSAFPEDHKIDVGKLMRLWVAEGFAVKTDFNEEEIVLEDIARTYVHDLKQRCLIMVHEEFDHGDDEYHEYCRVHDVVRELSIKEAKKANFMNSEMTGSRNEVMHRLSLQGKFSSDKFEGTSLSLRTLLSFTKEPIAFEKFYLLRVLDLEGSGIAELPEEVGDMVLLRYLSIKDTECKFLPHSISRLSYLETLDCRARHLPEIHDNVLKIKMLKNVYGKFRLDKVDVSYPIWARIVCCSGATTDFAEDLRSRSIMIERFPRNPFDPDPHTVGFRGNRSIIIERFQSPLAESAVALLPQTIRSHLPRCMFVRGHSILCPIRHMISLQELSIHCDDFIKEDSAQTIWDDLQILPSLKVLSLTKFVVEKMSNYENGFPNLQRLSMIKCRSYSWQVEKGSMPSLEILVMKECSSFYVLPSGLAQCKKLRKIICMGMNAEFVKWYDKSKEEAAWEFHHVQSITVLRDTYGMEDID